MTTEPLHVGIVIDSLVAPKWIARCVDAIRASAAAEISLVIVNAAPATDPPASPGAVLYRLYERLDKRRNGTADDPLDPVDISPALASAPRITLQGSEPAGDDLRRIGAAKLDVLLDLGRMPLSGTGEDSARLGVWRYDFGAMSPDGLTIDPRLVRQTSGGAEVLYRSPTGIHHASPTRARANVYYKAAAFAARALRAALQGPAPSPAETAPVKPTAPLRQLGQIARRIAANRIEGLRSRDQWILGVRFRALQDPPGPSLSFGDFTLIEPPADRFWADPFPLEHDGRRYVFFEDYPYATRKGHLSVVEIDAEGKAGEPTEVLNTGFHLSFPNVFMHEGALYMLPETSAARQVQLYRCERFPDRWALAAVLIDAIVALDPVVFERDGRWWMFVGTREPGTDASDELSLFHAPSLFGPWTPHRANPVRSTVFAARPAGNVYEVAGSLYRPAQDCSRRYGYGLAINRVERVTESDYSETEVGRVHAEEHGFIGVHTVNHNERFTVADFLRRAPLPRGR